MKVLVTGSSGLIGSESVKYYDARANLVVGLDNNMREHFFGSDGNTEWRRKELESCCINFKHHHIDIRDRAKVRKVIAEVQPDLIIHCAAQPSHDLAAKIPFEDFDVNAVGTLNLLEATRKENPQAIFIFMSTNKVYGDAPNYIKLQELETRWDYDNPEFFHGIPETFSIDHSLHSLFGASKVAADVMVQEYGRYFGMRTATFRGGCLTGPGHAGAELHGFLSYFFKAARSGKVYTIFGYKGKQVRDQIHSHDVVRAFDAFYRNPRCAAVYNLGGGKANSASILECIDKIERLLDKTISYDYQEQNRIGDHICYYSDLRKFKHDYPDWELEYSLDKILEEMASHDSAPHS